MYIMCISDAYEDQKRLSEVTDGGELPRGCWEANSGPLQKTKVLLTAEPLFQPRGILNTANHHILTILIDSGMLTLLPKESVFKCFRTWHFFDL